MKPSTLRTLALVLLAVVICPTALAQDAAEMARKLQDPLANIKAIMSDNDVMFKTGQDETSYSSNIQPVYAIPYEDKGFNLVLRALIPILDIAPGGQKPILGEPLPPGEDRTFGLSDIVVQSFFSPRTDSSWKWGIGPMVSLKTRTDDKLSGPGWGAGPIAVLVGNLSENISTAVVGGHLWGDEMGFSTTLIQPMLFYNIPTAPGWEVNYNNTITYDWNADSGNRWTVPLGAGVGKTFALESGLGLNLGLGYYYNVEKPQGAADSLLRININFIFP